MAFPAHQRVVRIGGVALGAFLIVGAIFGALNDASALIPPAITYVGSIVLLIALPAVHLTLRRFPMSWSVNRQDMRLNGLGATPIVATLGIIGLLWAPRAINYIRTPVDRTSIDWAGRLWNGETLTVEIGDLPVHARGGLLVEGRAYSVHFQQEPCVWHSSGPAQQRSGDVVEGHVNKSGPSIKPYLETKESGTATAECNSPRDWKMLVLGLPADFDRHGWVSFGGANNRIGQIQIP